MNTRGIQRRGLAHSEWITYLGYAVAVLTVAVAIANPAMRKMVNESSGAMVGAIIGVVLGWGILALWVKLGTWAAESGHKIVAWIVTALLAANVFLSVIAIAGLLVMGDKLLETPQPTNSIIQKDGTIVPDTSGSQPVASNTPRSAPTPPASTTRPSPGIAGSSTRTPVAIADSSASSSDPSTTSPTEVTAKANLDKAAAALVPEMREFAKAVAQPPAADRKAIEDRKALAVATLAKVEAVRQQIKGAPDNLRDTMTKGGASEGDAAAARTRAVLKWDLARRTTGADDLHELVSLAIKECDSLQAALGSWKLEGARIVGKDAAQTSELGDARFFLKAKLGQMETRLQQVQGK